MEYGKIGLLFFSNWKSNDVFLFSKMKKKACWLLDKIKYNFSNQQKHVSPSCLYFFSLSLFLKEKFLCYFFFFIYFRERFNISWCKSLQNSYRGTSHTSHHIICSSISTIRISDTSNLFIKYMLKTKIGFQLNSLQCVYSMLKRSLLFHIWIP